MSDTKIKLYFACDHAGFDTKQELINLCKSFEKVEVIDLSPTLVSGDDYPDVASSLAKALESEMGVLGKTVFGIAICGTGQGICIALNRNRFIRAIISDYEDVVRLCRDHNDANVICFAGKYTVPEKAIQEILYFASTPFSDEERHMRRINKIS
jgi:ribose 5-phosphate isomerase B